MGGEAGDTYRKQSHRKLTSLINKDKAFREAKKTLGIKFIPAKRGTLAGTGHFRSIRRPKRRPAPSKIIGRLTV